MPGSGERRSSQEGRPRRRRRRRGRERGAGLGYVSFLVARGGGVGGPHGESPVMEAGQTGDAPGEPDGLRLRENRAARGPGSHKLHTRLRAGMVVQSVRGADEKNDGGKKNARRPSPSARGGAQGECKGHSWGVSPLCYSSPSLGILGEDPGRVKSGVRGYDDGPTRLSLQARHQD